MQSTLHSWNWSAPSQEVPMAKADLELKRADSIRSELEQLHHLISRRAYELFRDGGSGWGPIGDWLTAERELVWKPAVELREKGHQFEVLAALAGVEPKDLDVQVTPEELLIKADITHQHTDDEGRVHFCEFKPGKLWRSIRFPDPIEPATAKAEYRNGLLRLTAAIAAREPKKVAVTTA
jgi:HSP20 family protein